MDRALFEHPRAQPLDPWRVEQSLVDATDLGLHTTLDVFGEERRRVAETSMAHSMAELAYYRRLGVERLTCCALHGGCGFSQHC